MEYSSRKCFINWSSGKDAMLSLYRMKNDPSWEVDSLLTTINKKASRISMHGLQESLLEEQAKQLDIPLRKVYLPENTDMETYSQIMRKQLGYYQSKQIEYAVYGDIYLEDLKKYREEQIAQMGFKGIFPLWKNDPKELVLQLLELNFKAIITCVNAQKLDKSFAGRIIDENFLADLPTGVDPCGENGEFHTFVFDGPLFKNQVKFKLGETVVKTYSAASADAQSHWDNKFYFKELLLAY